MGKTRYNYRVNSNQDIPEAVTNNNKTIFFREDKRKYIFYTLRNGYFCSLLFRAQMYSRKGCCSNVVVTESLLVHTTYDGHVERGKAS